MTTPVTYGRGTPKPTTTLTRVCAAIGAALSASAIPAAKSTRFIGHLRPAFLERSCQTRRRRRNGNCRGHLGRRRRRRGEAHSVTWPGHYCPRGPAAGVNATVAGRPAASVARLLRPRRGVPTPSWRKCDDHRRSEEHTSELQSPCNLV